MSEQEELEMELYFTLMDAAYFVDHYGVDKFLEMMVQYCINPEQEDLISKVLSKLERTKELH